MAKKGSKKGAPSGAPKTETEASVTEVVEATEVTETAEQTSPDVTEVAEATEVTEVTEQEQPDLADTAAPESAENEEVPASAVAFPKRYRLSNNTRMKLSLPVVDVQVDGGGEAEFEAQTEAQVRALLIELDTLAELNEFGANAFVVAPTE